MGMEKIPKKRLQRSLSQLEILRNKTIDPLTGKYIEDVNTGINDIHSTSQNIDESIDDDTRKNLSLAFVENISRSAENVETEKIFDLTVDQKIKLQAIASNLNEIFSSRKYAQVPSDNEILRRQIKSQITDTGSGRVSQAFEFLIKHWKNISRDEITPKTLKTFSQTSKIVFEILMSQKGKTAKSDTVASAFLKKFFLFTRDWVLSSPIVKALVKTLKIFSNPITKAACISVETGTDLIGEHWKIVAATSCAAIVTFLFFQNFINSY